ncbi:Ankyrin-1 [Camellia lanceoleosa]|uniref:Ankyrin-1 n=1 Tax=Camellia lanceoleosa TaxID=1840588 RepID=A0ACC0J471_9ERIC|nr:Ankyrin-1 [Camellia lanceoleosa]
MKMEIDAYADNSEERSGRFQLIEVFSKMINDQFHRLMERQVRNELSWVIRPIKLCFRMKKTLHKACEDGDLKSVEELIRENKDSCLAKNEFGFTPLHIAAQKGRIGVVDLILKYCPEAVKEVTAKTMRTCVHVAVNHNQIEVVMHLLRWVIGERPDFLYLLSLKDYKGKTAVQFSTSSKQFQIIRVSLPLNPGGSVALDISYDLPHSKNIDFEIDGISEEPRAMIDWDLTKQNIIHSDLYSDNGSYDIPQSENMDIEIDRTLQQRRATLAWDLTKQKIKHNDVYGDNGSYDLPQSENMHIGIGKIRQEPKAMMAWDLTKQKTKHNDDYSHGGLSNGSRELTTQKMKHNDDYSHRGLSNGLSEISTVMRIIGFRNVLLLIATLFATITFQVPFHLLGSTSKDCYIHDSIMSRSLMLLNSMVFIASVGIIIFLLHEFPLKPWPHISISALFGSYMFSLKAVSPNEGPALFFISIPILLVGICRKTLWLFKQKSSVST